MLEEHALAFEDGRARSLVDTSVYRLSAIKKAAYRFADRCTIVFGSPTEGLVPLEFLFEPATTDEVVRTVVAAFFRELLDQELRELVSQETAPLRALILAQAFSKTDLIRRR